MTLRRRLQLAYSTEDGWMKTALRVAFASADKQHVDQHFGAASGFAIYAVDLDQARLLEAVEFEQSDMDGNEDKLTAKIAVLSGCAAVYSQAVGASAIRQLKAQGIQPVKVAPGTEIGALLGELREELRRGPQSWVARAIAARQPADPGRFDVMEAEGWEE